jgi:hypothetical protein
MSLVSNVAPPDQPETYEWVNEGGSLKPNAAIRLPEGVIAVASTRYKVGPYSYSRLEDALAEHGRQSSPQGIRSASN